jgi:putative ABC transport system ATP-binding protein
MNEPLLEVDCVGRRHSNGSDWLLDGVSLRIDHGARVVVAGPTGGGKTLLLRPMSHLDPLDRGEIRYRGGRVCNDAIPRYRADVIYLHQRASLIEDTVEAALRRPFALWVHRQRRFDRDQVDRLLDDLGREPGFLSKKVSELSGGEIQITALVRAMQLDPTILLLDEPTAALDGSTAIALETVVDRWLTENPERAIVWVSHNEAQAQRVGRVLLYLEAGRLSVSPPLPPGEG